MKYIVKITLNNHSDFIMEGNSYTLHGERFVPLTERFAEAKRYSTYKIAKRASERHGENMYGTIEILEVDE